MKIIWAAFVSEFIRTKDQKKRQEKKNVKAEENKASRGRKCAKRIVKKRKRWRKDKETIKPSTNLQILCAKSDFRLSADNKEYVNVHINDTAESERLN